MNENSYNGSRFLSINICVYMCVRLCICVYIYIYMCVCVCVCVCMYVCIYVFVCVLRWKGMLQFAAYLTVIIYYPNQV